MSANVAAFADIRRSGRATKGQHKGLEPAEVTTPKNKKGTATASHKKSNKKSAEPEPELDVDEGDEEAAEDVIRCVCGDTKDDEIGRQYISCDTCEVWQHNVCMGVPLEEERQPEHYFCEICGPEDHKELLDAMARGEQLWQTRINDHEAEKRRKRNEKKRPKSRQSKAARQSEVKSEAPASEKASPAPAPTPAPAASIPPPTSQDSAPAAGSKRKFEEETPQKEEPAVAAEAQPEAPEPTRSVSSSASQSKRRKSEQKKEEKIDADTALVDIKHLPKERQNPAQALVKVFGDVVRERITSGSYSLGQGENAESVSHHNATRIEYELYQVYGAPPSSQGYTQQFRAIHANMKKNPMLVQRMLDGSLTAHGLVTMSTQDMASEELQKQRQLLKEEADKQAVMMRDDEDDKPRVRRTHKGDEYIDDQAENTHESVFTSAPVRSREETDKPPTPDADAHTTAGAAASPDAMDIDRRESNFDINSVWAKTPADQQAQPTRRRSSFTKTQTPQEKGEKHDADVDRMLADDNETDYAPPEADGVVWKGQLIQPGVTEFTACARHAAGNDFGQFMPWTEVLPPVLEIEGRLDAKRADDYLCGLQWSKKSDVSVLALTPYDNRAAFDQIFDYFASRGRYAVIGKGRGMSSIVKDVYITPVGPGHNLPPHINLLEYNSLDPNVPERMLVVTFVVNKPDHWDNLAVRDAPQPIGASPVNGNNTHGPQFSPRPPQGFTPMQNGHSQQQFAGAPMPPNPYAGQPPASQQAYAAPNSGAGAYPSPSPQLPPHQNPMVHGILGALAHTPVVAQILSAAGNNVEEHVLLNMRDILASDPAAREDLTIFSQRLAGMGTQGTQQG
ncbi:hypothetical protein D6D28_07541 [Aureobasidium pullulans]|uniref:Transcription factor BYE1 n=1 Tax=Aureobasidium pullulans TaxID=5580 RepID=A0A4S8SAG2_AURPU|nr:hypothetical protein D6D28_07541 [Aureobasidium pullulans]